MSLVNNAYIRLVNAGSEFARIDDFEYCSLERVVNGISRIEVRLRKKAYTSSLQHKTVVELYRRDPANGVAWGRIFNGYLLAQRWESSDPGDYVTLRAYGANYLLATRIVAWKAGTASRSVFTAAKAETIMKTLVDYNAGPNATTGNGRIRTGTITNLSIQSDGAGGNTVDWACAYDNLLDTLQRLAKIAGGDFAVVSDLAAATPYIQFRYYPGQLGSDLTASVLFSTGLGNLTDISWLSDQSNEVTVAIVGGDGEGDLRNITTVQDATRYSSANDVEAFVNASDITTANGRTDRGKKRLAELAPVTDFKFRALQTPSTVPYKHFTLGDKVAVLNPYNGLTYTAKVPRMVTTFYPDGEEKTDTELELLDVLT